MSLEEFEDKLTPRQRKYILMQSIRDWGFGVLYIGVGLLLIFAEKLNFRSDFTQSPIAKIFAGIIILYGIFRIYRGVKKDYFIEKD